MKKLTISLVNLTRHPKFFCFVCGILLAIFGSLAMSLLIPQPAFAQRVSDLSTLQLSGNSKEALPNDAAREVTATLTSQTARQQVIEIVGEAAFQKNKAAIEEKILKKTSAYIPFVNAGEPEKQRDGSWTVPVELKISYASLRKALLDHGFLGSNAGASSLLPLISFTDRARSLNLRWWTNDQKPEQKQLAQLQSLLHAKLAEEIKKQNLVFAVPPDAEQNALLESLRQERPSPSDQTAIANFFKSAMLIRGDVRLLPSNTAGSGTVAVKLQVIPSSSPDRVIAEVVREFSSDANASSLDAGIRTKAATEFALLAKDLAAQVQAAWQRGTVGTNFLSLAVRGNLNPLQQTAFKTSFVRAVREARDVKERLFERNQVVYEVDFSGDANQFISRVKALKFAGFDIRVPDGQAGSRLVTVDVRAD